MRVRLRMTPDEDWVVESRHWYNFEWMYRRFFSGGDAYDRAYYYAKALKRPRIEEVA